MSTIYTSDTAGQILGVCRDQVPRHARRLGVGQRLGRVWIFTASDIAALRKSVKGRVGNPNFWKKDLENKGKKESQKNNRKNH